MQHISVANGVATVICETAGESDLECECEYLALCTFESKLALESLEGGALANGAFLGIDSDIREDMTCPVGEANEEDASALPFLYLIHI